MARKHAERDRLIVRVAAALLTGVPTYFQHEGSIRHGIRSSLCLEGWRWAAADAHAAHILTHAFLDIGAKRPTWEQGQGDHCRTDADGRTFCAREDCRAQITREGIRRYCSERCRLIANNRRAYNRAKRKVRGAAHRAAQRAAAAPRICAWEACQREFKPLDYTGKPPQIYCSRSCSLRARVNEIGP
jgi:hypothetical protein